MSLQEPEKKMSKSDPIQGSIIFLTDTDEQIINKIKRAVTDSGNEVKFDEENKPGVANLMTLYHIATGKSMSEIESEFAGKGYGDFKSQVGDSVAEFIRPIRTRYNELIANKDELAKILISGGEKARHTALRTLRKVYKKVGFVQF
jgi:tryptophanyl-tRNA synthetase